MPFIIDKYHSYPKFALTFNIQNWHKQQQKHQHQKTTERYLSRSYHENYWNKKENNNKKMHQLTENEQKEKKTSSRK